MHVKALSPLVSFISAFFSKLAAETGSSTEHLVHHSVQFEEGTTNTT